MAMRVVPAEQVALNMQWSIAGLAFKLGLIPCPQVVLHFHCSLCGALEPSRGQGYFYDDSGSACVACLADQYGKLVRRCWKLC